MKKQGRSDRMDESLGMRNGPERNKKQSYKDRRDESMGMKKPHVSKSGPDRGFMGECKSVPVFGSHRGYPADAWDYRY